MKKNLLFPPCNMIAVQNLYWNHFRLQRVLKSHLNFVSIKFFLTWLEETRRLRKRFPLNWQSQPALSLQTARKDTITERGSEVANQKIMHCANRKRSTKYRTEKAASM